MRKDAKYRVRLGVAQAKARFRAKIAFTTKKTILKPFGVAYGKSMVN